MVSRLSPHREAIGYQRGTKQWQQCIQKMYAIAARENAAQSSGGYQCCSTVAGGVACLTNPCVVHARPAKLFRRVIPGRSP